MTKGFERGVVWGALKDPPTEYPTVFKIFFFFFFNKICSIHTYILSNGRN